MLIRRDHFNSDARSGQSAACRKVSGTELCSTTDEDIGRSEVTFREISEFVAIGMLQCDSDGSIVHANVSWQESTGLALEQSLGIGWFECVHPDDLPKVLAQWNRLIEAGTDFELEFRVLRPDREIRHLRIRARRMRPQASQCGGYIACVEDVTESRRIEQERCEHSVILECSLNEIFIFDAETLQFEFVNEGARRNLGYGMNELREMTPLDIKPLFNRTTFEVAISPLRTGKKDVLAFQTVHRRACGTDYDVEIRLQMSRKANRPVFLAIILDITERLALEAENAKNNSLQRAILDHAAYAIIATTTNGVITKFNTAAEQLLGYKSDEMVDRCTPSTFHLESECVARAEEFSHELNRHVEPGFDVFIVKSKLDLPNEHEWTYVRKNGSHVVVMLGVTALRNDVGEITGYIGIAKDITGQKRAEAKLESAAVTDQLTSLPNRTLFLDRIRRSILSARTQKSYFAVMFLDFDHFKSVNDTWGHDVGDELLRMIADRLRNSIRPSDIADSTTCNTIARLGGDEFVVLLQNLKHPDDAEIVAKRLQDTLSKPYELGKHQVYSTASIGLVVGPSDYHRAEDVLRDADTAMYEAKRGGRARHIVFDEKMRTKVERRFRMENDLRHAIGTSQLSLNFQPIVSLVTGRLTAVEALVRWQHPTLGTVSPGEFIPIAQESDLILHVGNWVLEEACRQFSEWRQTLGDFAPPRISINLARKQFADPDLLDTITAAIQKTGAEPHRLQFEVTEDAFSLNMEEAVQTMNSIKALGVRLAIDDFGSGTSSFVALQQFPVDVLKIDRTLITGIEESTEGAALLQGLVVMAANLDVELVAEGVETRSQLKAVQQLGCECIQGFYFARPMPVDQLECFLLEDTEFTLDAQSARSFISEMPDSATCLVPSGVHENV